MAFWICGVPGMAVMAKENEPRPMAAGAKRLGMPASWNSSRAMGQMANTTTKTVTPP